MSTVIVTEVALACLTLTAIGGFARLYRDGSFFLPLAVMALAGHALAAACRRKNVRPPLVALIAVIAGAVLTVWLFFGGTTVLGVPTPHTLDVANAAFHRAWDRFGVVTAPAAVLPGFQMVAALAVWAGIWFADWAAFRLWAAAEALAPAAVLFVFGSLLGAPDHRISTTVLFAAAALTFMLLHRVARQEATGTWVASAPGTGRRSLLRAGGAIAAVALVGGAVFGPHLPGADKEALLTWREGTGGTGSRVTVSPLVDIRKRLVDQSGKEAFNVRSDRPAYWRLTSLETFDGRIWSSGGSFSQADGRLPQASPRIRSARRVTQEFEIGALDAIWVPAAFEASSVDPGDSQLRWDADSATLIVDDNRSTSDGLIYNVVSEAPQFTVAELSRSDDSVPASIGRTYLELPQNFSGEAARLARTVTRSGRNPYERALLLQNWFRERFSYDLAVPPGHSEDAIADFLASRRGYCEQFAGTYAAMARSIGLPSRVAVGFTPGDVDPSDPELYHVKGKQAHAWPEVWFGNVGPGGDQQGQWVPFEPTPGRGAPGAEAYTGVRPQQDGAASRPGAPTTVPETVPTTAPAASQPKLRPGESNLDAGNEPNAPKNSRSALSNPLAIIVFVLLAAAISYVGLALGFPWARRRRARARAVTTTDRVALAWNEASAAVARGGSTLPFSSETHHEYASRVAAVLGPAAHAHGELASVASASAWSNAAPAEASVDRAETLSKGIQLEISQRSTARDRARRRLDPHRLQSLKPPNRPSRGTARTRGPGKRD